MGTTAKPIINLVLDEELLARVDEFWHEQRFKARSEAIRWLIAAALDKKLSPLTPSGRPASRSIIATFKKRD